MRDSRRRTTGMRHLVAGAVDGAVHIWRAAYAGSGSMPVRMG